MSPKTKQYVLLGVIASTVLALVLGSLSMMQDQPTAPAQPVAAAGQQSTTNITAPGGTVDPQAVWREQTTQQMKQQEEMIHALREQMAKASAVQPTPVMAQPVLPPLPPQPRPSIGPAQIEPPVPSTVSATSGVQDTSPRKQAEPGIASFDVSPTAPPLKVQEDERSLGYVPAGSFARVALLGGLDAPAGGQAQGNPLPVLMRVQDNAVLPNKRRFSIKACFVIASAYGDISSERAYAKLETLSCIRNDNTAVDMPVKGYIIGEDGKAGLRGRLVSKQGQLLANSLIAGFGSGMGQFFQSQGVQSVSPLGSTQTLNSNQALGNAAANGVGKSLDRLSKYYLDLAEKLFPVIEIDAGRTIEIVFTKGFYFGKGAGGSDGRYSEIWKRGRALMGESLDPYPNNDNFGGN